MKQKIIFITLLLFQVFALTTVCAQPAPVKKAARSVVSITTFNANGTLHSSTNGVLIGQNGEIMAMWNPFEGAQRATVFDADGKSYEVDAILGVSELYDVCKIRIKGKAPAGLSLATTDQPATTAFLADYAVKKANVKKITPLRSEKFMTTNNYYVFNDVDVSNTDLGCPLVNPQGQLLGIMQRHKTGGQAFSADARLTSTFKINGLSINDNSLRATGIRTALPDDEQQATLMLMVATQQPDSLRNEAYLDEFIQKFPTSTEGYKTRASRFVAQHKLAQADEMFNRETKHAAKKDEAWFDYAQAMYQAVAYKVDTTYSSWNYDRAMQLAQQAEKLNPLPIYKHLQAQIVYAQGNYAKALEMFTALQQTNMSKSGDIFYEAAQCKTMLKAPKTEILPLLDAAVNAQQGVTSAPFILARGQFHDNNGEYRKAFIDYLKYDTLMNLRATHDFYYLKFQCEKKLRQYQLALNDIAHAIVLNRTEPIYYAEMGSLQLQVNLPKEAVATCNMGLKVTQDYADLYIIKGIGLCETKQKAEGLASLQRAKELGDDRAEALIAKYKK